MGKKLSINFQKKQLIKEFGEKLIATYDNQAILDLTKEDILKSGRTTCMITNDVPTQVKYIVDINLHMGPKETYRTFRDRLNVRFIKFKDMYCLINLIDKYIEEFVGNVIIGFKSVRTYSDNRTEVRQIIRPAAYLRADS